MDLFNERIVTKKKDYVDYAIIVATIIVSFIIAYMAILLSGPVYFSIGLTIVVIVGYFGYKIITSRNVEFEYSLTNSDLEISKIISKRKRKRLFYGSCRQFEIIDKLSSTKHSSVASSITSKIQSVTTMKSPDVYFFTTQYSGSKVIVYFEPNEKLLTALKSLNKRAFL